MNETFQHKEKKFVGEIFLLDNQAAFAVNKASHVKRVKKWGVENRIL